jgi:hypothetical protein
MVEQRMRRIDNLVAAVFKRPWRDGSTALLVDPLELLERLAALVPPPRRPLLASLVPTPVLRCRAMKQ